MSSEKLINAKATKSKELKELGSIRWREKQNIVLYLMCIQINKIVCEKEAFSNVVFINY
jgi:hypothetical protein